MIAVPSLAAAQTAGPVYVRESGPAVVLGNDYLERTISVADGEVGTTRFLNKVSGRVYAVRGSEFEIKVVNETVGYDFGHENPVLMTARGQRVTERKVEDIAGGGKRVVLHLGANTGGRGGRGGRGGGNRGPEVDLYYELRPADFFTRSWLHLSKPTQGTLFLDSVSVLKTSFGLPRFSLGGFGQPLFAEDLFLGVEYPSSRNQAQGSDVDLGGYIGVTVPAEGYTSEPAVIGATPVGMVHPRFLDYVKQMRVAPVRPYLLYNSWYDLQRLAMNHDNTVERVGSLNSLLLRKYGLKLDSFVLDDGWDDMHKLWTIDSQRFPGGFTDLAAALKGIGSRMGMWFGPIGGYSQRNVRIETGRQEGMEVTSNGQYLCIAGAKYSRLLSDAMARYQKEYGVNYYKIDGTPYGCNQPDHGHPVGVYADEAVNRALIGMMNRLRSQDKDVFLNITTSIWLSPWWLRYADTVWMGGADSGYLPTVPTMAQRQSAISYRDSVLYSDFVTHQAQFPISSLMTHGIIKGKYNMLGGKQEYIDDWRDEVVHYYSVGNMMYELYISPDILSPEEMDALGNTTRWAIANAHPLLDSSTMVLGDPAQREPYGYVHASPEKSIVMLRNPFVRPESVQLKIDRDHGFVESDHPMRLEVQYPYRRTQAGAVRYGDTLNFELGGYEEIVLELRPASDNDVRIEGARYLITKAKDGADTIRVYAPEGSTETIRITGASTGSFPAPLKLHFGAASAVPQELNFSPADLQVEGQPGQDRTLRLQTTLQVPGDYRETKAAFLLEPEVENRTIKAEALDNGKSAALTTENGGRGVWHWFWVNVTPGRHTLEFSIHLPAGPAGARVSGWLLTKRQLASHEIRAAFPVGRSIEEDLLPATSGVERGTYKLIDEHVQ